MSLAIVHVADISHCLGTFRGDFTRRTFDCDSVFCYLEIPDPVVVWHAPCWGFPGGAEIKNLPAMQEMQVRSLGWEGPLKEEMAAHSSMLTWRIPWTEESTGYKSIGHH